jgi:gluconokinase
MFLGIDIGTTAIKFGIIEERKIIYTHSLPITTHRHGLKQTQSASEIKSQLIAGVTMLPDEWKTAITAIGLSTAMHSLMPVVGDEGEEVYIWSDNQASEVMTAFRKTELAADFYQETGTPIHAMSPFAKLAYFQSNHSFDKNTKWYGLKELAMELFTGEVYIDYSTASATGLFSLKEKQWSQKILNYLSLSKAQLAPLCAPTDRFLIAKEMAERCGLSPTIEVMCGASDGCLAAYSGYISTGIRNSLTIGTSAAVRKVSETAVFDRQKQNFCYYLQEELFVVGAPSNNGGCVLEWAKETLAEDPDAFYYSLPHVMEESPIGSKGLRFYPYLNGERAPFWSNDITGGFSGLTLKHNRSDMLRAVIEGMLMNIGLLKEMVQLEEAVTISGGFFQTKLLGQMTADVLGLTCYLSEENEPIFGLYDLYRHSAVGNEQPSEKFIPDSQSQEGYQELAIHYFDAERN